MHSNTDVSDEMMLMNEKSLKKTRYKIENNDQFVNDENYMSTNNENENDDEKNDDENNEKNIDKNVENNNDDEIMIIFD